MMMDDGDDHGWSSSFMMTMHGNDDTSCWCMLRMRMDGGLWWTMEYYDACYRYWLSMADDDGGMMMMHDDDGDGWWRGWWWMKEMVTDYADEWWRWWAIQMDDGWLMLRTHADASRWWWMAMMNHDDDDDERRRSWMMITDFDGDDDEC